MATSAITGSILDLTGDPHAASPVGVRLWLQSSEDFIGIGASARTGGMQPIAVAADGSVNHDGIPETVAGTPMYRLHVESTHLRAAGRQPGVTSGWFALPAGGITLGEIAETYFAPTLVEPGMYASIVDLVAAAQADRSAVAADRQAVADDRAYVENLVITDLGTTDGQMAAIDASVSSQFREQQDMRLTEATTKPRPASDVTQGLYARTQPMPGGGTFRVLAKDPYHHGANGTGRIWGVHGSFAQIGYSDDDGATWQVKSGPLVPGLSPQQMTFTANYVWMVVSSTANCSGQVWRMARPTANGNPAGVGTDAANNLWGTTVAAASNGVAINSTSTIDIVNGNYFPSSGTVTVMTSNGPQVVNYTGKTLGSLTGVTTSGTGTMSTGGFVHNAFCLFNLTGRVNGPGGAAGDGGVNSAFRNACFAIDDAETHAYVGEYGNANVTHQLPAWSDGHMAAGSSLLYTFAGSACAQMAGLSVTVAGAGPGGGNLVATVQEVINYGSAAEAACLRLAAPARTAVAGVAVTFPNVAYGNGNIPGGPSVYHCANPTAAPTAVTWSKAKQFPGGKHIHSVRIFGGLPWVGIGDLSIQFPANGIHIATSLSSPTVWQHRSLGPEGRIPRDPINMLLVTADDGRQVVACESDSSFRDGPLIFSDPTGTGNRVLEASCTLPQPYTQTMRGLTFDPATRNLYWYGTTEGGALGPTSCIWMARAPWTVPVLLEDVGSSMDLETVGDAVLSNGYIWFGTQRVRAEKFLDQ